MRDKLQNVAGCVGLLILAFLPGLVVAWFLHSSSWIVIGFLAFVLFLALVAAFGPKRKVTPQQWAAELERHLDGSEGPYDWDDTTGVALADESLERLRSTLIPEYDLLDTPEKRDRFRQIIAALRRGEIPD